METRAEFGGEVRGEVREETPILFIGGAAPVGMQN
jgi:hypothetical protein